MRGVLTSQGSLLFVTYTIIQGIISSEMQVDRGRKIQHNMRKVRRKKITPRLCSLGSTSVRTGKTPQHKHIHHKQHDYSTGEVIQLQQAAIWSPQATIPALVRPACQAGGSKQLKATEARDGGGEVCVCVCVCSSL